MSSATTTIFNCLTEDILHKTSSTEEVRETPRPGSKYLSDIWNYQARNIDARIHRHNRNFPKGNRTLWTEHLVSLSKDIETALDLKKRKFYTLSRPPIKGLPGIKLFDEVRAPALTIRSLKGFEESFKTFCGFTLDGLVWDNVFIAGGSVLAALSASDAESSHELYRDSDIDIFVYGLDHRQAERKLNDIITVLRTNISGFDGWYEVERTVGVVTFKPNAQGRGRKIQVVLRLAANPAEILAGFDLDQVCLGYDGVDVRFSLRAVRALYTGYTVTTGAINASYAARIIKYACRGYGIIVRPSDGGTKLLQKLQQTSETEKTRASETFSNCPHCDRSNFGLFYMKTKHRSQGLWTHSFSSLAMLDGIWKIADRERRVVDLLKVLGNDQSIYGGYQTDDAVANNFGVDEWMGVLVQLVPSLARSNPLPMGSIWKLKTDKLTPNSLKQRMTMIIIMPARLRLFFISAAPHVCNSETLVLIRGSGVLMDTNKGAMEICLWHLDGSNMWQPARGLPAQIHHFLVRAAMLTAWTVFKMFYGAPWNKLNYSRSLKEAQVFSASPAVASEAECASWVRS
ncbi:hypothetical protein CF319_g7864 [Tilletia indica]|nr:hypothetical protein CF319_g7864 [Tilletia indica]